MGLAGLSCYEAMPHSFDSLHGLNLDSPDYKGFQNLGSVDISDKPNRTESGVSQSGSGQRREPTVPTSGGLCSASPPPLQTETSEVS